MRSVQTDGSTQLQSSRASPARLASDYPGTLVGLGSVCPSFTTSTFLRPFAPRPLRRFDATMDAPTPAGLSAARQVSLVHVHGHRRRSVSNHPMPFRCRFITLPISATDSHATARGWTSPVTRRLVRTSGRIEFVILRTDSSSPVASHLASRRRSYSRLQAGERMPEEDFHLPDHARFQAHECAEGSPLWHAAARASCYALRASQDES